jgi:hypothetical protein
MIYLVPSPSFHSQYHYSTPWNLRRWERVIKRPMKRLILARRTSKQNICFSADSVRDRDGIQSVTYLGRCSALQAWRSISTVSALVTLIWKIDKTWSVYKHGSRVTILGGGEGRGEGELAYSSASEALSQTGTFTLLVRTKTLSVTCLQYLSYFVLNIFIHDTIFRDITLCSPFKVNRRFGGPYGLHLQGKNTARKQVKSQVRKRSCPIYGTHLPAGTEGNNESLSNLIRPKFENGNSRMQVEMVTATVAYSQISKLPDESYLLRYNAV